MKALTLKAPVLSLIALVVLFTAGCSSGIDGEYKDSTGLSTVELKSGKATVKMGAMAFDADYKVDGDKVTITHQGENIVLTRKSDGSLVSDNVTFTKK